MSSCCYCCLAAAERGELDHRLSRTRCPYETCDWCDPVTDDDFRATRAFVHNASLDAP